MLKNQKDFLTIHNKYRDERDIAIELQPQESV